MVKARTVVVDNEGNADATTEAIDFAALNEDSGGSLFNAVDELRAGGASDVVCIVTRQLPVEKKGFCCNIAVPEFSLEKMRAMVGPGKYMVRIRGPRGFLPGGGMVKITGRNETKRLIGHWQRFFEIIWKRWRVVKRSEDKAATERQAKIWELAMVSVPTLLAGLFQSPPTHE